MNDMRERMNAIVQDESKTAALLAAGCVMPRFKVGQTVWCAHAPESIQAYEVLAARFSSVGVTYECYGFPVPITEKSLYATAAEAQAAMEKQ